MDSVQLPLWLSVGLAVFIGLVAVWQVPRIRVRLSRDYATEDAKTESVSGLKHWGKFLIGFLLFLVLGVFGEAWLWTQQTYLMADGNENESQSLPLNYTLKKPLWQLGFVPIPKLVSIPAGEFSMGSETGLSREKPVHKVTIPKPFSMSQHEITFEQYDYFIWQMHKAGIRQRIEGKESSYLYPLGEGWGRGNRPVVNVSWWDAQAYTHWVSNTTNQHCRLPSEAEWEYAARGGSTTKYPWGDEIGSNNANCIDCGSKWDNSIPAPVASFKPNAFGLNDMNGNVWEWVQDSWHDDYEGAPNNTEVWEATSGDANRVLRGGSWVQGLDGIRSASRAYSAPSDIRATTGFRIVCSSL